MDNIFYVFPFSTLALVLLRLVVKDTSTLQGYVAVFTSTLFYGNGK